MSVRLTCCLQLLLLVNSLLWSAVQMQCTGNVSEAFYLGRLVPDLVPEAPGELLNVRYKLDLEVCLGNEISPLEAATAPEVTWPVSMEGYFYTLALVDPDSLPVSPFLHYLVVNIQGNDTSSGSTIASYLLPTPPPASGLHRYTFLLYMYRDLIPENIISTLLTQTLERPGFNINDFARVNNLGNPVAGNYFRSQTL